MANVTFTVPNKNGSYDGDMVVKQYTSLTINTGDVVTTDQPCRGLFILVQGNCTINGTLTMSARGASANPTVSGASDNNSVNSNGLQFPFFTVGGNETLTSANTLLNGCGTLARSVIANFPSLSSNGTILKSVRIGATGGAEADAYNTDATHSGNTGNTIANGTGGGGSGMAYYYARSRVGATGSCFSGGSGSGAIRSYPPAGNNTNSSSPVDYGGQGGQGQHYGQFNNVTGGGAGNPAGGSTGTSTGGTNGTGGLIILVVKGNLIIGASGVITANGSLGGYTSDDVNNTEGGSSGGGRIIIAHKGTYTNNGTVQANGGIKSAGAGGNGGAGSITVQQVK